MCYALYQEDRDLVSGEVPYSCVGIWIDENFRTRIAILSLSYNVHKNCDSWQRDKLHPLIVMVFQLWHVFSLGFRQK